MIIFGGIDVPKRPSDAPDMCPREGSTLESRDLRLGAGLDGRGQVASTATEAVKRSERDVRVYRIHGNQRRPDEHTRRTLVRCRRPMSKGVPLGPVLRVAELEGETPINDGWRGTPQVSELTLHLPDATPT